MDIELEFEMLWKVVDKKTAKQVAKKAFIKNFRALYLFARSKNKTIAQIYSDWKKGEYITRNLLDEEVAIDKKKLQFVCHLATWLNGHRWEDEHYIPEPEEKDLWFNSSTGKIEMGKSLGIEYIEDEEPFPVFKKKVLSKVKQKFGTLKGDENEILSTRH